MTDASLDLWIARLNDGEPEAVERVLAAYEPMLRIAVRRRLGARLRSKVDSVDIVQSVFADVLSGLRKGGWRFDGRPQMFAFLRRIAWRRIADRHQQFRHALVRERSLDGAGAGSEPVALPDLGTPRPSEVAQGREFWDRVLRECPPHHREVVRLRAGGLKMAEIAGRTSLHEGSVRRILYDLARKLSLGPRSDRPGDDGPDPGLPGGPA